MKKYIEILGTNAKNRGAELMAIAIKQRFDQRGHEVELVVDSRFGTYKNRARHGFFVTNHNAGSGVKKLVRNLIFNRLPAQLRNTLGIVRNRQISAVIDASGFAYSDQWGAPHAQRISAQLNSKDYQGKKFILLPQALGKFDNPQVAQHCKALFQRACLVFARDTQSYQYANGLGEIPHLKQCPDFTVAVRPDKARNEELPEKFAAIVPNARMLDKTQDAESYVEFMRQCVEFIKAQDLQPIFILHDSNEDQKVIKQIDPSGELPIYTDEDPAVLKGMLGQAQFVAGSRFHALVSALSQGVLCIGAGWSHKYPELFKEFGVSDYLISDFTNSVEIEAVFNRLRDTQVYQADQDTLNNAVTNVKGQVEQMWLAVEKELGL